MRPQPAGISLPSACLRFAELFLVYASIVDQHVEAGAVLAHLVCQVADSGEGGKVCYVAPRGAAAAAARLLNLAHSLLNAGLVSAETSRQQQQASSPHIDTLMQGGFLLRRTKGRWRLAAVSRLPRTLPTCRALGQ